LRIVVIGASGHIGGCIFQEALRRGHATTAAVRDVSTFEATPATVVAVDVFGQAALAAAIAGADVVVSAVGHSASLDDHDYYARAARSLIGVLRAAGTGTGRPRLLVVGGFGSLQTEPGVQFADSGRVPDHAVPEIVGQRDALTYYRTIEDVQWTYFSPPPGGIWPGERTGTYRTALDTYPGGGKSHETRVTREDFAVAVIDEAERPQHLFACVAVAN
jgi:uncharacterized protein